MWRDRTEVKRGERRRVGRRQVTHDTFGVYQIVLRCITLYRAYLDGMQTQQGVRFSNMLVVQVKSG